jgi:hypothetical protein
MEIFAVVSISGCAAWNVPFKVDTVTAWMRKALQDIFVTQLSFVTVTNELLRTYAEEVESIPFLRIIFLLVESTIIIYFYIYLFWCRMAEEPQTRGKFQK